MLVLEWVANNVVLAGAMLALGFVIGFDAGKGEGYRRTLELLQPGRKPFMRPCPGWLSWTMNRLGSRGQATTDDEARVYPHRVQ